MSTTANRIQPTGLAELRVEREGISFRNVSRDRVELEITIDNRSSARSEPTRLRVEAAPFGAFVPWRPLTTIHVPPIRPGGSKRVTAIVRQPRLAPAGGFSGLVPPSVLTAVGGQGRRRTAPAPDAFAVLRVLSILGELGGRTGELPSDLHDLLEGPVPHWAGNLNVWIGRTPVERHMAPRLRIHPGRANLAMFCVGGRPDRYAFRIECSEEGWGHALYDPMAGRTVACSEDPELDPRWYAVPATLPLFFVLRPTEFCERGSAVVHVTQHSSGKTALVEFDLDPEADGPGCYRL